VIAFEFESIGHVGRSYHTPEVLYLVLMRINPFYLQINHYVKYLEESRIPTVNLAATAARRAKIPDAHVTLMKKNMSKKR
jgi:hypothetical protein